MNMCGRGVHFDTNFSKNNIKHDMDSIEVFRIPCVMDLLQLEDINSIHKISPH